MKKIKFLAAAVLLLTVYSCKKTGMDVYVGSWYVKSEKLEFLALDSVSEKLYENSYLFKFEREGVYHSIKVNDTTYTGSWAMLESDNDLMILDGLSYTIGDKQKHGFRLTKKDIGLDSVMRTIVFERTN
ncbi:MAG TPA: hypothetical protein VIL57_08955 [Bacteroidia bacterium]